MRVLHLTSPFMDGLDVKRVQKELGLLEDGVYGPATGSAVAAWKYRMGFPEDALNTGMGEEAQRIMFRPAGEKLPTLYRWRRMNRQEAGFTPGKGLPFYNPAMALEVMRDWARRGLHETSRNVVPELVSIGKVHHADAAAMGYPWCAYSALLAGLVNGGASAKAGLADGKFNGLYCPAILAAAQNAQFGMRVVGASQAKAGDLVLFDFDGGVVDHIGRVVASPYRGSVKTVEGNTSVGDSGSQNNGDGVYERTRPMSIVRAFVRDS